MPLRGFWLEIADLVVFSDHFAPKGDFIAIGGYSIQGSSEYVVPCTPGG